MELIKIWNRLISKKVPDAAYYFILEGDYFCPKKKVSMLVLRARYQRNALIRPTKEIIQNRDLLQTLSPIDTFIIGILAHQDRNGFREERYESIEKMRRLKNRNCAVKLDVILKITKINFNSLGHEKIHIFSPAANKEVDISISELLKNQMLLHALDPLETLSLGYSVSECWMRYQTNSGGNDAAARIA